MPNLSKVREMHIKTQEAISDPTGKFKIYINQELARLWENRNPTLQVSI